MKFDTIEQIRAHQFAGNHFSDAEAFGAITDFVSDKARPIADRAEALRIMSDKGMGMGRDEHVSDADLVGLFEEWS